MLWEDVFFSVYISALDCPDWPVFSTMTHLFHTALVPDILVMSLQSLSSLSEPGWPPLHSQHQQCPPIPLAQQYSKGSQKEKQNHLLWKILLVLCWNVHTVCPVPCTQTQMKFCFLPVSSCWITTSFPLHLGGREFKGVVEDSEQELWLQASGWRE